MAADIKPPAFAELKQMDFQAMFKKHSWKDPTEVNIEQYFTAEELAEMCEYEKDRLRNIKKNYEIMLDLGLPAKKPHFMVKNRQSYIKPVVESTSESDGDWVPSKEKERAKRAMTTKSSWNPPTQIKKKENVGKPTKKEISKRKDKRKEMPVRTKPDASKTCTKVDRKTKSIPIPKSTPAGDNTILSLFESDSEDEDFEGFSVDEIAESERRMKEIIKRNEALLQDLEAGRFDLEIDEEEAGDESPVAQPKDIAEAGMSAGRETEPPKRYPRRSVSRKDYKEQELPKDDDYLYCEECDHEYEGDCPVHGPLVVIEDTKVANDGSDANRAEHSLPKGLMVKKSKIPMAGEGVWADSPIPKGIRFGPYEGMRLEDDEVAQKSGYCWVIYKDGKEVSHYIDAENKSYANWLRFVNCARNETEQNLLAYQYHGAIYYRTIQPISKGSELLVWYGDEFGKELGITEGPDIQVLYDQAGFEMWPCEVCGRVFTSEQWRDQHRRHHGDRTGSKRHVCQLCNYSSDNMASYARHMRTHTGEKPYSCTVCGQGFSMPHHLKGHMRTHTGEKPYSCTVCGWGFSVSGSLKNHMRTHTGEKPYSCTVCGQSFSMSCSLKNHMRTHTGEKPYTCTVCGQGFSELGHLKRHMVTHTGKYPHTCGLCGRGFMQPGELRKHQHKVH